MSDKILFVDDEQNVLSAIERTLRRDFKVNTALSGQEGLAKIKDQGPFAVVVSDMRMPGMDGIQFLSEVKEISPDSVRIMLTGNADLQTAVDAVNEGNIFRFLNKPCPPEIMGKTLRSALDQYKLIKAEKDLLEQTLSGVVQMLTEILAISNQAAFGHATRVRGLVRQIAGEMNLQNAWQVEIAAMLSQIGFIAIPEETFRKFYNGYTLTPEENNLIHTYPQAGRDLVAHVPRLESVAEIISFQENLYNGKGFPFTDVRGDDIPLGARILKVALDFDKIAEGKLSPVEAFQELEKRSDWYDPKVLEALKKSINPSIEYEKKHLFLAEIRPGMKLAEGIKNSYGNLLLESGYEITPSFLLHLWTFVERGIIKEPFTVLVPVKKDESSN